MIEILIKFIDLFKIAFTNLFNFKVELIEGQPISIGSLFVAFVLFITMIYLIFNYALGFSKGDD